MTLKIRSQSAEQEVRRHSRKRIVKKGVNLTATYLLLSVLAILCAGPFLWMFLTSIKSGQNIYDLTLWVKNPTLDNYTGVIEYLDLTKYIGNTLIITFFSILLDVVFSAMCAYPLACIDFHGKNLVNSLLMAAMIIPAAASMIINYLTIRNLHLINTYAGVILPGAVKVFSVVLMRQAFFKVPKEMTEAAELDGAGEFMILWRITLPQIFPTAITIIVMDFIGKWNEYLWPIISLTDPSLYPLSTALQYLNSSLSYKFGYIAAGTVISVLPVTILFFFCQKYYVDAVSGAVKG